jgi:NAD(P)H-flavin reductase
VNPADPENLSKMLAPEAMRGCGGILLDGRGRRFCNELGTRAYVTQQIQEKCLPGPQCKAFLIMSGQTAESFGTAPLGFYASKGVVQLCQGADAVAQLIGCDESAVIASLRDYADIANRAGGIDPFGKVTFPSGDWEDATQLFHVAIITPCIHYTMGGVLIGTSAEVLRVRPSGVYAPILGLFAAGEVTGGVHGMNRLAGNSLLECVVFGRLAGRRAAQITQDYLPALDTNVHTPLRLRYKKCVSEKGHMYEFSFELPSARSTVFPFINVGQYIALELEDETGTVKDRYYSPITRDNQHGCIDLLIKAAPDGGLMQTKLHNIQPGDMVNMRGPMGGFDFSVSSGEIPKIGMIAGGVGISPMVAIIRQCLHGNAPTELRLLWGAELEEDLIYKDAMDRAVIAHGNLLKVNYVLHKPTESWEGDSGYIDETILKKFMFSPLDHTKVMWPNTQSVHVMADNLTASFPPPLQIIVCGPWSMCQAMKSLLKEMGYSESQVGNLKGAQNNYGSVSCDVGRQFTPPPLPMYRFTVICNALKHV